MINYLKSSISISSYDGCTIGCKYCILSSFDNRNNIRKVVDEEELVSELLTFKLYTNTVPITINNQTDPFLNKQVSDSTIKILSILEKRNVKNPIILITKGYINDSLIEKLSKINLCLIVLYTFSGISEKLENRNEKMQIETMKKLSKLKNIKLLNYFRPIIEGVNSDTDSIEHVVSIVTKYCKASIVSGIRINTHLNKVLSDLGVTIPEKYDPDHKVLLPETFNRVLNIFEKKNTSYPVFKKTSCGISYILNRADYNGHSARIYYCTPDCISYPICIGNAKIGFCNSKCPNYSNCKKESENKITEEQFKELLAKIGLENSKFDIEEHYIKLHGTYWQEEVSYLRHITKKNIKADKLLKREDEFFISM